MTKLFALAGAFAVAAALQLGPLGVAWAQDVGQAAPTGAPQFYQTPPAAPVLFITSIEVLQTTLAPTNTAEEVESYRTADGMDYEVMFSPRDHGVPYYIVARIDSCVRNAVTP